MPIAAHEDAAQLGPAAIGIAPKCSCCVQGRCGRVRVMDAPDSPNPLHPPLGWLDHGTLQVMEQVKHAALACGQGVEGAMAAIREVAWARYPAFPATMIAEAVAAVMPDRHEVEAARGEVPHIARCGFTAGDA
jgi:hypothetical protein